MDVGVIQAVRVGQPVGVHRLVLTRSDAVDLILTAADEDVAAGAAVRIDGLGLLEEPDAHLEAEILGSQCADGTDVDGVKGIVAVEPLARMNREMRVAAAIDESQAIILRDLVHETDAARAENAALIIEDDPLTDVDMLRLLHLGILEAGVGVSVFDGELLQAALTRLVADGAVQRVVDEEKLHDALAAILDQRGIRADSKSLGNLDGAADGGFRTPVDQGTAILPQLRLAVGTHLRGSHLDQAHAAVARGA